MNARWAAKWVKKLVSSGSGPNYLAFSGGIQVATGISTLVLLRASSAQSSLVLAVLVIVSVLFLLSGFVSRKLSWEMSSIRISAERAGPTVLEVDDLILHDLAAASSLCRIRMKRLRRLTVLLVVDGAMTVAAVVLFAGTALWWN